MSSIVFQPTRKQAGCIFKAWKEGRIKVERETINRLYNYADNGWEGTLDTTHQGLLKAAVSRTIKALMDGASGNAEAQEHIDAFTRYAKAKTYEELRNVKPAPLSPSAAKAKEEAMASLAWWTAR